MFLVARQKLAEIGYFLFVVAGLQKEEVSCVSACPVEVTDLFYIYLVYIAAGSKFLEALFIFV